MPRYAVLSHDWPMPHFDLLLEDGDVCRTWRLPTWPPVNGMSVERIADHRIMYLDYDGPVSGDRGTVTTVERGLFEWQSRSHGELTFDLDCLWPRLVKADDKRKELPEGREPPPSSRRILIRDGRLLLSGQGQPGQ
jgi:hypothetical protein